MRLASPEHHNGIEILRRGYNFTDGSDGFGHLDAGLFFIAFVRNPVTQFIPMQAELSRGTCSTSTSPTPEPRCSRSRRDCAKVTTTPTGVRHCSAKPTHYVLIARL